MTNRLEKLSKEIAFLEDKAKDRYIQMIEWEYIVEALSDDDSADLQEKYDEHRLLSKAMANKRFEHICMACGGVGYLEAHSDMCITSKLKIVCESCGETLVIWSQGW